MNCKTKRFMRLSTIMGDVNYKVRIKNVLIITVTMEQHALKNVNNFNVNIYSYLETSGGQNYNIYLNVVHFFNTSVN
jgi:hypothetical protein